MPAPIATTQNEQTLRASHPTSNAGIVFGGETSKCLWEEGEGQVEKRVRERKIPTGGGRMGRQGDSRGHLTHAPAPGQCLPSAFSRCLGTERSFSLDLGAEPEAGSAPHRLWVLYARKHRGLKVRNIRVPEMPGVSSSCLTGGNQVYRGEPLAQGHRHLAGPGLGPRPFALHLSVAT